MSLSYQEHYETRNATRTEPSVSVEMGSASNIHSMYMRKSRDLAEFEQRPPEAQDEAPGAPQRRNTLPLPDWLDWTQTDDGDKDRVFRPRSKAKRSCNLCCEKALVETGDCALTRSSLTSVFFRFGE